MDVGWYVASFLCCLGRIDNEWEPRDWDPLSATIPASSLRRYDTNLGDLNVFALAVDPSSLNCAGFEQFDLGTLVLSVAHDMRRAFQFVSWQDAIAVDGLGLVDSGKQTPLYFC